MVTEDILNESVASSPSKRFVSYNSITQELASSKLDLAIVSTEHDAMKKEYRTLEKSTCALKLELADLKSKLESSQHEMMTLSSASGTTDALTGTSKYLGWLRR